jgi:hypothetical protein
MKRRIISTTLALSLIGLVLVSCKKDEDDNTNNPTPTPKPTVEDVYPQPSDANGVLVAIKSLSYTDMPMVGEIKTELGLASAFFMTTAGDYTSLTNAGKVTVNNEELKIMSNANNAYVSSTGTTNATGIDYSSGVEWIVAGSASVNGFTQEYNTFPTGDPNITSGDVTLSQDYVLTIKNEIYACDSIYFNLYSSKGSLIKTAPAGTKSMTFTSAELQTIGASDFGMIQVVAMRTRDFTHNSKKYYFVNETVTTKTVKMK